MDDGKIPRWYAFRLEHAQDRLTWQNHQTIAVIDSIKASGCHKVSLYQVISFILGRVLACMLHVHEYVWCFDMLRSAIPGNGGLTDRPLWAKLHE